jgi:hypothetical protein
MRSGSLASFVVTGILLTSGCATELPVSPESPEIKTPVVFGRAITLLTGETSRWYKPQVRFFELINRQTLERYSIEVASDDKMFVLQLPAGEYELTRVQISEGPFMSMADLASTFQVGADPITYVGTWRFGIDSPRYGRMMVISAVRDQQEQAQAQRALFEQYRILDGQAVVAALPTPNEAQTRLYEVMPYPRYPRYFRRHWW